MTVKLVKLVMTDMGAFNSDFLDECPVNFLEEEDPEAHLMPKGVQEATPWLLAPVPA